MFNFNTVKNKNNKCIQSVKNIKSISNIHKINNLYTQYEIDKQ